MIVLSPHCDLHVALNGTPQLRLRVERWDLAPDRRRYTLTDVTTQCSFDFFAPYNPVGSRLQPFVNIDPATGTVTPLAVGINLVQIRLDRDYLVARIQVHDTILGWWFGHSSITTALDPDVAHSLPSIYALFSEDAYPTDRVGDISGHGYVTLQSADPSVFVVAPNGRLRGVAETSTNPATLNGTFLGVTRPLPVRVFDYARTRQSLVSVRSADRSQPQNLHNMLFLAEGFRDTPADRNRFDEVVTKIVEQIFTKERHAPYNLLRDRFNIWKANLPSQQHGLTCAYNITGETTPGTPGDGYPIPHPHDVSTSKTAYSLKELIPIVGLPLRSDAARSRTELVSRWNAQSLSQAFAPARVDDAVIAAWKTQRSIGILEARDTLFGLCYGTRFADRSSGFDFDRTLPPAQDHAGDPLLARFVLRVYEWFSAGVTRVIVFDPRRHPPELFRRGTISPGNSVLSFIGNLRDAEAPHAAVGQEWMPDPSVEPPFQKSRGLIAVIANDGVNGGANLNDSTMVTGSLNKGTLVGFELDDSDNRRVMRRTPPDPVNLDLQECIDTIAHEFGHTFNLADEYETSAIDTPEAFTGRDNVTVLASINLDADFRTNRKLDPAKVKWFALPRIEISDTLVAPSQTVGGEMHVRIDPAQIGKWFEVQSQGLEVSLRGVHISGRGVLLPQPTDPQHLLERLRIVGTIDEIAGVIPLGGPQMPSTPPAFPAGSYLFIPKSDPDSGFPMLVVEKQVLDFLKSTNLPLNKSQERNVVPNSNPDEPVDVPGFKAPCDRYKLIGIYEGAQYATGMAYRPTGLCKMRRQSEDGPGDGEFCHVCKYLIVSRIEPALHGLLDLRYYPTPKKRNG